MIVEGVGPKAPMQIQVRLTRNELIAVKDIAIERAAFRQYRGRCDTWGRGIKDEIEIAGVGTLPRDVRPIFAGTLGEYAVKSWLQSRVSGTVELDLSLKQTGDYGVDLQAYGLTMQVKTRQNMERVNLIRHTTERGYRLTWPWVAACFCEWTSGGSVVYLVGWQWKSAIEQMPLEIGVAGGWLNVEVRDESLLPFARLAHELDTWRYARQCR